MAENPRKPERAGSMSDGDRALVSRRTPHRGLTAVPVEVSDEVTGVLQGSALIDARAKRPTNERLERLELARDVSDRRHGEVVDRLGKVEVAVAGVGGKMEILPSLVASLQDATRAMQAREQVTLTAQVQVDTAKKVEEIDARKVRREVGWKLMLAAGPVLLAAWEGLKALLHWKGVL